VANPMLKCSGYRAQNGKTFPCPTFDIVSEGDPGGKVVMVQCERCWRKELRARTRAYWRGVEQVQRNSAKGYKLNPEDAFSGIKYDAERK